MRILYIGYYKEKSDWGRQTVNNILALQEAGADLQIASINLGHKETPEALRELERKPWKDCDYCIQHVFPDHMVGSEEFKKNVGLFSSAFCNISQSAWPERLLMMDEVWIQSEAFFSCLTKPVLKKTKVVPMFTSVKPYLGPYRDLSMPERDGDFKFYTIVSSDEGLEKLLQAFHSEFDPSEPVSLVIQGQPGQHTEEHLEKICRKVKSSLGIHKSDQDYKKDVIISSPDVTQQNLYELHHYCDAYVSTNIELSFPYNEVDAFGFGNSVLAADMSAVNSYVKAYPVKSIYQTYLSKSQAFKDVCNGKNYTIEMCSKDLRLGMRHVYSEFLKNQVRHKIDNKTEAVKKLGRLSLKSVGELMMKELKR